MVINCETTLVRHALFWIRGHCEHQSFIGLLIFGQLVMIQDSGFCLPSSLLPFSSAFQCPLASPPEGEKHKEKETETLVGHVDICQNWYGKE